MKNGTKLEGSLPQLPPNDAPAEMGCLGCLFLEPEQSWDHFDKAQFLPTYFYDGRHSTIFQALSSMRDCGIGIDLVNLQTELKNKGRLESVGGLSYLMEIQNSVPSAANLPHYLATVVEKFQLRRSLQICTDHIANVSIDESNAEERICELEKRILSIRIQTDKGRVTSDPGAIMDALERDYQNAISGQQLVGLRTGLQALDNKLGIMDGLIFVAGMPSCGKTSIGFNCVQHVIFEEQQAAGIISLETVEKKVMHRLISARAQVNGRTILQGRATQEEIDAFAQAMGDWRLRQNQLHICARAGMDAREIGSVCRRMYKDGCRFFLVDYLQLIQARGNSRSERVGAACEGLKHISMELNVPTMVISSITKDAMKEEKMPTMADLKESGDIAYHADNVILLHCKDPEPKVRRVDGRIGKAKDGDIGSFSLSFHKAQYRFSDLEKDSRDD